VAASARYATHRRGPVAGAPSPWGAAIAPTTTETAARQSAAVQLRNVKKLPLAGSIRWHPTMTVFASKAAGTGRARGVIWAAWKEDTVPFAQGATP
jgi:hypothetical protein